MMSFALISFLLLDPFFDLPDEKGLRYNNSTSHILSHGGYVQISGHDTRVGLYSEMRVHSSLVPTESLGTRLDTLNCGLIAMDSIP